VLRGRGTRVRVKRLNNRKLTNGARITVTATLAGRLTTTVVDRIAKGRRIEGRPTCSLSGQRAAC
jgi:hypothetical protein